ncbi:MAG TPA: pyrimidine dimer DNA glycosylase/endonuclease V, partial [Verrucomicrobiae bacterium]|nr:pyrimidine dimer DNA glycosylase/endonuclease V [Verrucomicrobiae bacterium]
MRVWDLPPHLLCRSHLLGEHREIHAVWSILTSGRSGYRKHPETRRWKGKLAALLKRHDAVAAEMQARGYRHLTPLDPQLAAGTAETQEEFVNTPEEQEEILRRKNCG